MASTKECYEMKSESGGGVNGDEVGVGLGFVKFTRGLGRKRILISGHSTEESLPESAVKTPLKRQRSGTMIPNFQKSHLESLPRDLLIRVLCNVDHDDLDRLFLVSKPIRDAAMTAKQWHFAFSTPKKTPAFRNPIDFEDKHGDFDDIEPPNAPIQTKKNRGLWTKAKRESLSSIATALFT